MKLFIYFNALACSFFKPERASPVSFVCLVHSHASAHGVSPLFAPHFCGFLVELQLPTATQQHRVSFFFGNQKNFRAGNIHS
jgi:hypothetical protein